MALKHKVPQAKAKDLRRGWWRLLMRGTGYRWLNASLIAVVLVALLALVVRPFVAHADVISTPDTALDSLWNTYGNQRGQWTGGDSTVSVALPVGGALQTSLFLLHVAI